jgi:hypothetical protein
MRAPLATVAIACVALAAPAAASAATLAVDPVKPCYREQEEVLLVAQGYTPNGFVDFTREGRLVRRLQANANGMIQGNLTLPGLIMGRRRLTYVGTDVADPAVKAEVTLLATATDVRVGPKDGPPDRRLTIDALGFFNGRILWAHVRRVGARAGRPVRSRAVRIGRVKGPCARVQARRRLFRRSTAPGRYRVQFDTHRRYRADRPIEYDELWVTINPASGR